MASTAASMVNLALTQVGYKEGANNYNKYAEQTPGIQVDWAIYGPWCQSFISWLAWKTDNRDIIPATASCSVCTDYYKQRSAFNRSPRVGSLAMFGSEGGTHVELVIGVFNGGRDIEVVGGNTREYPAPNGDGVYRKTYRNWASTTRILGFGHPAYSGAGVVHDSGGSSGKYKIKAGQTLGGIAAVLGVTLASLLAANPQISDPDHVQEGQEVTVPAKPSEKPKPPAKDSDETSTPSPAPEPESATGTYTVRSGDSLSAVARAHGMSLARLLALNPGITDPDVIAAGQALKVTGTPRPVPSTGDSGRSKTPPPKPAPRPGPAKPGADWTERFDRIDQELREVKGELSKIKDRVKGNPEPKQPEPHKPVEPPAPTKPTKPEPVRPVMPDVSKPTDIPVVPQQVIPTPEVKSAA
ncbi:LysM peptidoglycan-binding domain-containing protein [Streptomyces sp. ISL-11]|uniref:LysM peptidoglycan-binding domain-containing protein n=1 Tax=Streptomyces sp. ISL-11 TaxID=2819174 RepID=UPI001BE4F75E|nr:LysM peptidoglycan-binding domain-containing protein [Streptomyces sp. ISL-11]MBT2383860.1 LysM peptidoglycan-binding domain-containing protein [Streptomyces sp. ISL-11]